MAAGSIVVDLLMKTGSFETDTQRASKALKQFQKDADLAGKAIGVAFTGAVVGLGYLVKSTIDAQDHLNDLAKKTGIAADTLGGIGFAGQQAGLDIDSVSTAAGKLNKSLAEAASGNVQAAEAFKVLGINVKDAAGNTKTADVALAEIAEKFATYADGPEKAALALRIFGKAGADIIPLLDEGGKSLQANVEYFKKYSGVTAETAQKADAFNDTLQKVHLLSGAFGKTLTAELLPALQGLANLFLENKEKGDQFHGVATDLAELLKGVALAASVAAIGFVSFGKGIAGALAAADAAKNFRFGEAIAISKETLADMGLAKDRISQIYSAIYDGQAKTGGEAASYSHEGRNAKKPSAPGLKALATGPVDDPTKKLLENQLKEIQAAIDREKDLLQTRNQFIDLYDSQNLLSLKDYYSARRVAQDDATKAEVDGYTQQINALRAFQGKATTSQTDRAGAEVKITEAVAKRAKAQLDAGAQGILLSEQERFAAEALVKQYEAVNAQVLDLKENFTAAAAIKFDLQNDALRKTFSANGNAAGLQALDTLRAAAIAQAAFQKASVDAGRTLDSLSRQEDYVALAQQRGAITSLEGLIKVGEARRAQIPILEAQVAAEEAIAKASGNPALIANAAAARLALDKLKASADPLAESLNKVFGDEFNSALDDFVTGTKSASEAFHAFARGVLNDILKMGSKSITESIFGGSGGGGGLISGYASSGGGVGLGGLLGSLFGGSSGGATAGASSSDLAGIFGVYEQGTNYVPKTGPAFLHEGEAVIPKKFNVPGYGANSQHINVSVQATPGMSRDTAQQQGASIGLGIQRALARNT